jgi:hypothetical protein
MERVHGESDRWGALQSVFVNQLGGEIKGKSRGNDCPAVVKGVLQTELVSVCE